jgi:hypothetical protein
MAVDLLVLGAPKAGTTALYGYLDQHPDLAMATPKEPHFFDANYDGDVETYLDTHFTGGSTALGEATPHYLFAPHVPERLHRHAPEVPLVAVLRDPVERAYSDWWMYWTRDTEPLAFEEAIEANLARLEEGPSFLGDDAEERWTTYYRETQSGSPRRIQHRPYVEIGHYADQLDRYLEHFSPDQISLFTSRQLREDPAEVVQSIWHKLGLDMDVELGSPHRRNEAMGGLARPIYRAARAVGLESALHALPRGIRTKLKKVTARLDERPAMDSQIRQRLARHYEPHNQRLAKGTDLDLSHWTAT